VLGEAEDIAAIPPQSNPAPSAPPPQEPEQEPESVEPPPETNEVGKGLPTPPELAKIWNDGGRMDVATQLMFTPASYVDFVDLCFIIGHASGRELGAMLDELAESENVPVPEPSADYANVLQRVAQQRGDRDRTPMPSV
jgi:hypothetical protein